MSAAVLNNDGASSGQQVDRHDRTNSMIRGSNSSSGISHVGSESGSSPAGILWFGNITGFLAISGMALFAIFFAILARLM